MIKTLLAAALIASLAAPVLAQDKADEKSFTRDGQTYVYTKTVKPDRIVLRGRRYPSGDGFELVVRGDHITGVSGGTPVSYTIKGAQAKIMPAQLALR